MKKAAGITNLSNLSKLAFGMAPISNAERGRRRNNRLRQAAARQSAARAAAKRNKTPSPPKRRNKTPSPPKRRNKTPSPPKRRNRTPSPPKLTVGAQAQLPVIITHPNGRVEVLFRTTKGYYAPNASKQYGYNLSKRV